MSKFRSGGSIKINAYAGTGKTSTLEMLAHATPRRGQYLAFNRDIVADARKRFPNTVNCSTTHGLAFRALAGRYGGASQKLTGKMNANQLAELLGLKPWRIDKDHALRPRSQGFLILDTVRRFTMSADEEPGDNHVPQHGSLLAAPPGTLRAVNEFAVNWAKHVWQRMQDRADRMPLGHDGYLKLWALSKPQIAADFILLDEAQDTNPAVLDALRSQPAQMAYVGDRYQQIYEWRGAVNAMEKIDTEHVTYLTTSFRFGPEIAAAATKLLATLGERRPLSGNPQRSSRIGPTPRVAAILARTNASTITAIIDALDQRLRPHLVGGTEELMTMLRGVAALKQGEPSDVPEFFGFANWKEVVEFARSGEGESLQTFVNLVETRGERQLMWAVGQSVEADRCDLVVSTAHRAKGREWPTVRLMDDFMRSRRRDDDDREPIDPGELRLLYVALTRAKESIEVPPPLAEMLGLSASQVGPEARPAGVAPVPPSRPTNPGPKAAAIPAVPQKRPSPPPPPRQYSPPPSLPSQPAPAPAQTPKVQGSPLRPVTAPGPGPKEPVAGPRQPDSPAQVKRKGLLKWLFGR